MFYVQNVSTPYIVGGNFILLNFLPFSHLPVKNMGYLGKEQADTCIPHRVD